MDCSLPGSSDHGIFQARVLEWGAIAFSVSITDRLLINTNPQGQGLLSLLTLGGPTLFSHTNTITEKAMAPHSGALVRKIPWTVGCSPWGLYESDTTERLHFHFLLLCIGEGNGNPLQCSCLENPRDGGA